MSALAQLMARESLRDIEINLRAPHKHFYRMSVRRKTVSRTKLANACRVRSWEVFADLAHHLIKTARVLYADELGAERDHGRYSVRTRLDDNRFGFEPV